MILEHPVDYIYISSGSLYRYFIYLFYLLYNQLCFMLWIKHDIQKWNVSMKIYHAFIYPIPNFYMHNLKPRAQYVKFNI